MRQVNDDVAVDAICNDFYINQDWYSEEEYDSDRNFVYIPPPIHDVWLDEQGSCDT